MTRSLATGAYTEAQIAAQFRSSTARHGRRFEILDNADNFVSDLTTVQAATVDYDVDTKIVGGLSLTMLPEPTLVGKFLQRRIRPWYRLGMPDGGIAEWPMGIYPWTRPKRSLTKKGVEVWTIQLGDKLHLLDLAGPGIDGFRAPAGALVRDVLAYLLLRVGITDTSGIVQSTVTIPTDTVWSPWGRKDTSGQTDPKTLLDIAAQLHNWMGIYGPYIDWTGRYRATSVPDLSSAKPTVTYATTADSILQSFDADDDLSKLANRVIVNATQTTIWFAGSYAADADVLYPGHPASHAVTGFYIDKVVDDSVAISNADLQRRGDAELHQALSWYETPTVATLANPAQEPFDVIGLQWDGDTDYGAVRRIHSRALSFDLFAGTMAHRMNWLYG